MADPIMADPIVDHTLDPESPVSESKIHTLELDLELFEKVFDTDPFHGNIRKYLTAKEYYYLSQAYPQIIPISAEDCVEHTISDIERRLNDIFEKKYDGFVEVFQESRALIGGSFIIQCVLGEQWKSNLDIYVKAPENSNPGYAYWENYSSPLLDFFADSTFRHELPNIRDPYITSKYCHSREIMAIYKYWGVFNTQVNVIFIRTTKSPIEFFENSVDFDICQNFFTYRNREAILNIGNLNGILKRHVTLNEKWVDFTLDEESDKMKRVFSRYSKYFERGFTFTFPELVTQYFASYLTIGKERMFVNRTAGFDSITLLINPVYSDNKMTAYQTNLDEGINEKYFLNNISQRIGFSYKRDSNGTYNIVIDHTQASCNSQNCVWNRCFPENNHYHCEVVYIKKEHSRLLIRKGYTYKYSFPTNGFTLIVNGSS